MFIPVGHGWIHSFYWVYSKCPDIPGFFFVGKNRVYAQWRQVEEKKDEKSSIPPITHAFVCDNYKQFSSRIHFEPNFEVLLFYLNAYGKTDVIMHWSGRIRRCDKRCFNVGGCCGNLDHAVTPHQIPHMLTYAYNCTYNGPSLRINLNRRTSARAAVNPG